MMTPGRLEDRANARENFQPELGELRTAMIDRRLRDCGKDRQGRVGGSGNLQKMAAGMVCHVILPCAGPEVTPGPPICLF